MNRLFVITVGFLTIFSVGMAMRPTQKTIELTQKTIELTQKTIELTQKTIELTEENLVTLNTEITSKSVSDTIISINKNKSPVVYLFINSPGGSAIDGIVLVNYLKNTKLNIVCIAHYAASMARVILEACPVRVGLSDNILLQHLASSPIRGTYNELSQQMKIVEGLEDILNHTESERIGMSLEEFKRRVSVTWITFGEESLKENLLDEIDNVKCSSGLIDKVAKRVVKTLFGAVEVNGSACPLIP